ncbi:hypothetical protein B0H16DRAFT_1733061 [Mycena metata]|uniref:Uncharacterized protein n=1 Tax=Mycena metata TaxID=1033252 RepID=A0AAD7HZV6_9AGAR|nr:hypothetical protein B0H16DRAFT_1733061 [Mycena metata]
MVATRSSTASPRRVTRSSSTSSPPSTPSRKSGHRQALEQKHATLYPLTIKLGITGPKHIKRREVQRLIRILLELHSPRPPPSAALPYGHQGHCVEGMQLNTGAKSGNDSVAGSWIQPCGGDCKHGCSKANHAIFVITPPLPAATLADEQFQKLFRARKELYPARRSPRKTVKRPFFPPLPPVFEPSPSPPPPSSSPPPLSSSPMEDDLSLFGDVIMRQSQSPVPGPSHLNETLRFDNGGYGGAHYSPTGSILRGWEPAEPSVFAASPSPENVVFDASTPVAIIVWLDSGAPLRGKGFPRVDPDAQHIRLGKLHLMDCKSALQRLGVPAGAHLERFVDTSSPLLRSWVPITWEETISIYGRDKVVYLKTQDRYVALPDHSFELLDPDYFD